MNMAYKKTAHKKLRQIEKLQVGEQEKLALYLFSQHQSAIQKPLPASTRYFMDQTMQQVHAVETLGCRL